jgi:hypothetical protein
MLKTLLNRPLRALAPAAALLLLAGQALANGPEIARLAPERSFFVLSVPDWSQLRTRLEEGSAGRLWKEPVVSNLITRWSKEPKEQLEGLLKSAQIEIEDLKQPTGHVGLAFFLPDPAPDDDEDEVGPPLFLVVAELGDHAAQWEELLEDFLERALDDKTVTMDDDTYKDVKITLIKPVYEEDPHARCGDECVHEDNFLGSLLSGSFDDQRQLSIARVGTAMIFSSDLAAMEMAIDRWNGGGRDALADRAEYRDAMAQHDIQRDGSLAHAVLLTGPFFAVMDDDDTYGPSTRTLLDLIGLASLQSVSASVRLDTRNAVADMSLAVLIPDKGGLLDLYEPAGAFEPPSFVGPGAASVTRFAFRFDKLLDFGRSALRKLPDDAGKQMEAMLDQGSAMLGPALEAMGPLVHAVTTYRQPFSAESATMTWAIDLNDEATVSNVLVFLSGQFPSILETRDFEETVIYTVEFPVEIALATAFGRLFVGPPTAVEDALRAAARHDAPRLFDQREFRAATDPLSRDAIGYGYTDVKQWLRWTWWSIQNADKILEDTLDKIGIDQEYKADILRRAREERPEWHKDLPPVETITSHIGDLVYELRSTREGYAGRVLLLKPQEENR